jgi:hypothetical protein
VKAVICVPIFVFEKLTRSLLLRSEAEAPVVESTHHASLHQDIIIIIETKNRNKETEQKKNVKPFHFNLDQ